MPRTGGRPTSEEAAAARALLTSSPTVTSHRRTTTCSTAFSWGLKAMEGGGTGFRTKGPSGKRWRRESGLYICELFSSLTVNRSVQMASNVGNTQLWLQNMGWANTVFVLR